MLTQPWPELFGGDRCRRPYRSHRCSRPPPSALSTSPWATTSSTCTTWRESQSSTASRVACGRTSTRNRPAVAAPAASSMTLRSRSTSRSGSPLGEASTTKIRRAPVTVNGRGTAGTSTNRTSGVRPDWATKVSSARSYINSHGEHPAPAPPRTADAAEPPPQTGAAGRRRPPAATTPRPRPGTRTRTATPRAATLPAGCPLTRSDDGSVATSSRRLRVVPLEPEGRLRPVTRWASHHPHPVPTQTGPTTISTFRKVRAANESLLVRVQCYTRTTAALLPRSPGLAGESVAGVGAHEGGHCGPHPSRTRRDGWTCRPTRDSPRPGHCPVRPTFRRPRTRSTSIDPACPGRRQPAKSQVRAPCGRVARSRALRPPVRVGVRCGVGSFRQS